MTKRERVTAAVEHRQVDRIPMSDSFWEDTLLRWEEEGLTCTPREYFDFDIFSMSVDASPGFGSAIIEEDGRFIVLRDRFGYVAKKQKGMSRTLEYLEYPAADELGWEKVKSKFGAETGRLGELETTKIDDEGFPFRVSPVPTWAEAFEKYNDARNEDYYILASAYGPHEAVWRLHGFTETLIDLALDQERIHDMAETYVLHLLSVLKECRNRGFDFDGFMMVEDVAATRGMLFSPETWKAIYKPLVAEIGDFLRNQGVHFWMHGCGNAELIYEDLIECGLQVYNPLEAKSGLDLAELAPKYKGRLAFYGNIDATKMAVSEEVIDREIRRKIEAARCSGGYIYHSDHSVPPEVSFERYRYIVERVRAYGACDER